MLTRAGRVVLVDFGVARAVASGGTREPEAGHALWHPIQGEPARVPETPWSEAIRGAVAREPGDRLPSAQALARALEDVAVTLRLESCR